MVDLVCENCGVTFSVRNSRRFTARFCSSRCWTTSQESKQIVSQTQKQRHKENPTSGTTNPNYKARVVKTCLHCGKPIPLIPCRSNRIYCSQECSIAHRQGENSAAWKGGVTPATTKRCMKPEWRRIRAKVISERGNVCECCGEYGDNVHHIIAVKDGGTDDPSNLKVLCRSCHRYIEQYGKCICEAIREKCLSCSTVDCKKPTCPLYGHMPLRKDKPPKQTKAARDAKK